MGRGRQKAKQQKIARKLKYLTTDTDYDLDEYAKWAAEAAAKATSGEIPVTKAAAPKPHKPIPMPVPSALKPKKQD